MSEETEGTMFDERSEIVLKACNRYAEAVSIAINGCTIIDDTFDGKPPAAYGMFLSVVFGSVMADFLSGFVFNKKLQEEIGGCFLGTLHEKCEHLRNMNEELGIKKEKIGSFADLQEMFKNNLDDLK